MDRQNSLVGKESSTGELRQADETRNNEQTSWGTNAESGQYRSQHGGPNEGQRGGQYEQPYEGQYDRRYVSRYEGQYEGQPQGQSGQFGGQASQGSTIEKAKQTVNEVSAKAAQTVTTRLDSEKNRAADELSNVVDALRQTSRNLQQQHHEGAGPDYLNAAADRFERIATYVQSRSVRDMVGEVENLARRQPALFLGGSFLLGVLVARFFKSSNQATLPGRSMPSRYPR